MSKKKTRKAVLKRIKITGKKKFLRRKPGQDHFNAKESGKRTRRKRDDLKLNEVNKKIFKRELPYV